METNNNFVTPTGIAIALAVVVALAFLFIGPALFSPLEPESENLTAGAGQALEANPQGFMVTDTVVGEGKEAVPGTVVVVNYVGRFENGEVFDASANRGEPISFILGTGMVIPGWDQGLVGMKVGGKRSLVIPPELGYGSQPRGPIPANSTLYFDVELVDVQVPQQ